MRSNNRRPSREDSEDRSNRGDKVEAPRVFTPEGRVCFARVFTPDDFNDPPKYGLVLVFEENEDLSELKRACSKAALGKWGENAKLMAKRGLLRMPFRDGEEYAEKYGEPFIEGTTFISARSTRRPGVIDIEGNRIVDDENGDEFYSGCYARLSVAAWPYQNKGNKGVTFLLNNIMKTRDGEKLAGGGIDPEDEFADMIKRGSGKKSKGSKSDYDFLEE